MKKDWRERELTLEVVVGAFIVMILVGLGYFTIILSKESLFRQRTEMQVTFTDVMGLRVGDNVVVRGMPIGKVKTLDLLTGDTCAGVCVTLSMEKPVPMREGYQIRIVTTSILGGRQMQIYQGLDDAPLVVKDRYLGDPPYDLMGDAAKIVNAARKQIIEGQVFEKVRNITDQVDQVVTRVNAGEGLLGKVLSDDDTLYDDLQEVASSVRAIVDKVQRGEGIVGRLLAEDVTLYEDLEELIASVKRTALKIEAGEGTIGKLLSDEAVYNEIEAVVGEIRAAVDDFRETAPVTTFSSIFFGAF